MHAEYCTADVFMTGARDNIQQRLSSRKNQTADFPSTGNDRSLGALSGARNGKEDIADIAVQQLLNK